MNQWLQVELPQIKKITGIVTQGAKSLGKEMYVTFFSIEYSDNGMHWTQYTDDETQPVKVSCCSDLTWKLTFIKPVPRSLTSSFLSLCSDFSWEHEQQRPRQELHLPSHLLALHPNRPQNVDGLHHHENRAAGLRFWVTHVYCRY